MTCREIIDRLGLDAIAAAIPTVTPEGIRTWRRPQRGIPPRHWLALARLASTRPETADITVYAIERASRACAACRAEDAAA